MGPESDVQTNRAELETAAESELHPAALVARHTAAYGERAVALLGADMDDRPAAGIDDVAANRSVPPPVYI